MTDVFNKKKEAADHTFVVCAYQESPYLEACIRSLKKQTVSSRILIATSTPNRHIEKLAEKYGLELKVSGQKPQISGDWNFALSCARTSYVTLAHQDDRYFPEYTEKVLKALKKEDHPLIAFTDYYETREEKLVKENRLLRIKRLLLSPLGIRLFVRNIWVRRRILGFGNAICCPSVTYVINSLPKPVFTEHFRSNADWEAWERISREKGAFVYVKQPLMTHRIHEGSETSQVIGETGRGQEDYALFLKFWPKSAARILEHFYTAGEKSNQL